MVFFLCALCILLWLSSAFPCPRLLIRQSTGGKANREGVLTFLRPLFLLIVLSSTAFAALTTPAANKAKPVVPPAPALPATADVVTFVVHSDDQNHKFIVTTVPNLMRVDIPGDDYSVIYDDKTEHYIGLEHSNYTYWQFSWPEVSTAVESSKRYETRMQELNFAGISSDAPPATNIPTDTAPAIVPDTSGYVWKQTNDHKKIADLDCTRWTGETVSGDAVQAWCFNGPLPKVQTALERLHVINEPMALVAVRTLIPPFVFPVFSALAKGGVTPIQISWGGDREKNSFTFVKAESRETKPNLFSVPPLYMKTTLITMDGLIDQKK